MTGPELERLAVCLATLLRRESSMHEAEHRRELLGPLSDLPFGPYEEAELAHARAAMRDSIRRLSDAGVGLEDFFRARVWPRLLGPEGAN